MNPLTATLTAAALTATGAYQIQPGDTLSAIAATHDVTTQHLAELNGILNPDFIIAGDTLTITPPYPPGIPQSAYPLLDGPIREVAEIHNIPWQLLGALVWTESNFNVNALSPAGAQGLTQLMPPTARDLGVDPQVPYENLYGGAKYLAQQLNTFHTPTLALAAYNAGPGNVRKYQGVPPFPETQRYVALVLERWALLR